MGARRPRYNEGLDVKKEAILALFADRKMPAGQAARELGLQRLEFMELLRVRGIPYMIYTAEDLDQDVAALDRPTGFP